MAILVPGYHYDMVKLPRWKVNVAVALEVDKRIQWFPVRYMAGDVLGVEEERQVKIVKETYPHALDTIQMRLTKTSPWRPVLCIRRTEMADWVGAHLAGEVQDLRSWSLDRCQEDLLAAAAGSSGYHQQLASAVLKPAKVPLMRDEGPMVC